MLQEIRWPVFPHSLNDFISNLSHLIACAPVCVPVIYSQKLELNWSVLIGGGGVYIGCPQCSQKDLRPHQKIEEKIINPQMLEEMRMLRWRALARMYRFLRTNIWRFFVSFVGWNDLRGAFSDVCADTEADRTVDGHNCGFDIVNKVGVVARSIPEEI